MPVPVVEVWIMRMAMCEGRVHVPVGVRFAGRIAGRVCVLMIFVMDMPMLVLQRIVNVLMFVMFDKMQPDTDTHEQGGDDEPGRDRLAKHHHS